ncbi:MAG: hypothetical protein LBQ61_09090 [Spirochaetales bacterium]|jgi:hypothetical protein|nr:hypothetical protein [Spirochaetales bacterium]
MEVLEVQNLVKKDIPLHYRNEYSGKLLFRNPQGKESSVKIEFTLERDAIGNINIDVILVDKPDYPVLALLKNLKSHILDLDRQGKL